MAMAMATLGAVSGAAWPTSWRRPRTTWRDRDGKAGQPWGVEVRLPPGFDAGRADNTVRQTASKWAAESVQAIDGAPLPNLSDAVILPPAGASGPVFMVGANFRAILRDNNSTSDALAASLLAQGLAGGPGVQAPWPRHLQALDRAQTVALQTAPSERGFASGTPDGIMGPATRGVLRRLQRTLGLAADGWPTLDLASAPAGAVARAVEGVQYPALPCRDAAS